MKKSILAILAYFVFTAIQAQTYTGNLTLTTQAQVNAFAYTSVTGNLILHDGDITNLSPLSSLTTVGGDLQIYNIYGLANLNGLSSLSSVGGNLWFNGNFLLSNLNGLSSLTTVGGDVQIWTNRGLLNLNGLSSLTSVGGKLFIQNNFVLSVFCGLYPLINRGGVSGTYTVNGNALNPTEQEIIDDGACPLPPVPLSNWAIYIGILLIAIFMFVAYRKRETRFSHNNL
jgi:hypothetical protein